MILARFETIWIDDFKNYVIHSQLRFMDLTENFDAAYYPSRNICSQYAITSRMALDLILAS